MKLIVDKCNIMHMKKCNPKFTYTMLSSELTEILGLEYVIP